LKIFKKIYLSYTLKDFILKNCNLRVIIGPCTLISLVTDFYESDKNPFKEFIDLQERVYSHLYKLKKK